MNTNYEKIIKAIENKFGGIFEAIIIENKLYLVLNPSVPTIVRIKERFGKTNDEMFHLTLMSLEEIKTSLRKKYLKEIENIDTLEYFIDSKAIKCYANENTNVVLEGKCDIKLKGSFFINALIIDSNNISTDINTSFYVNDNMTLLAHENIDFGIGTVLFNSKAIYGTSNISGKNVVIDKHFKTNFEHTNLFINSDNKLHIASNSDIRANSVMLSSSDAIINQTSINANNINLDSNNLELSNSKLSCNNIKVSPAINLDGLKEHNTISVYNKPKVYFKR